MLVLLDIDGTLCDTYDIDGRCYVEALDRCFGIEIETNWEDFPETTDSAIFQQVFRSHRNRLPHDSESQQMITCFRGLLEEAFRANPNSCLPIQGGPEFISELRSLQVPFAIATGGWEQTARLKLLSAGYGDNDVPISSADHATRRTEICKRAVAAASEFHGKSLVPIVYFGDGLWDQRAAMQLGYRFIGRSADKAKFRDAEFVVKDFCEPDLLGRLMALRGASE